MFKSKITSSLEKVFLDESFDKYPTLERISALRGERISVQLVYLHEVDEENRPFLMYRPTLSGELAKYATVRDVKNVAVQKPVGVKYDDNYIRVKPGLYPDLLVPLGDNNSFCATDGALSALWIEITIPEEGCVGEKELTVSVTRISNGEQVSENSVTVDVIDAVLPEQKLIYTQWLYTESLTKYYGVKDFSPRYWEIVENYLMTAVRNGMNALYCFVLGYLVKIKRENEKYYFDYKNLDKWIDIANKHGIKYFEIEHFFRPGGAHYAVAATYIEKGKKKSFAGKRGSDPEYVDFLRAFLTDFVAHMKERGDDKRCLYHISDEPSKAAVDIFRNARNSIIDIIGEYTILDAIFDIDYWSEGLVSSPVPIVDNIEPFIEAKVDPLWTYYCCGPQTRCSNRFIAQSSACTRSIGMQMYKYNIIGFLHWALNYYGKYEDSGILNPYVDLSGNNWVPAGDTFTVYPANDGTPYESIRLLVFNDALQDMRAMSLYEKMYSHEEVVSAIDEVFGEPLKFSTCAKTSEKMLVIRERINKMIKDKICLS